MRIRWLATVLFVLVISSTHATLFVPRASAKDVTFPVEMLAPNRFSPDLIRVDPGDIVTIVVFNNDTIGHTFDIIEYGIHLGTSSSPIPRDENRTVTFTADLAGVFWFFCAIPGHASPRGDGSYSGMAGRLIVGIESPGADLTLVYLIGGGVAAVVAVAAILVLIRRRSPKG